MAPSPHTVLIEAVSVSQESDDPVTTETLAGGLGVPESELAEPIETLCSFEFLRETERGYQPTVTARELLALDLEFDEILVCDVVEE